MNYHDPPHSLTHNKIDLKQELFLYECISGMAKLATVFAYLGE